MTAADLAREAAGLAGVPFRLHGRSPQIGLDCIGLLVAACQAAGRPIALPNGYRLRSHALPDLRAIAREAGFTSITGEPLAGDVVMYRVNPCQHHLAIALDGNRLVHAHAGLGRIVIMPGPLPWPVAGHWRLALPAASAEPTCRT